MEGICRQQSKYYSKHFICLLSVGNKFGKRRKCWLPAFSPISTIFSKGFFLMGFNSCHCVIKHQLLTTRSRLLMTLRKKPFVNIVGKGENAGNQHFLFFPFLLFPQCFLPFPKQISVFIYI